MKCKISLCLAGIRPQFWQNFYNTALTSCSRYNFELVIISPYALPEELKKYDNIKYIKDCGTPVRATQRGAESCEGELITFPCDDSELLPDALDHAIDLFNAIGKHKDGIVVRYREGAGANAPSFDNSYWNARYHLGDPNLHIENHWKIAPIPMLRLDYFWEIGGFDGDTYEVMAFPSHDLCYRMQRDGGVYHLSPIEILNADNYGATGKDHAPIFYAQTEHDWSRFVEMYTNPNVVNRIKINYDWKQTPEVWSRRWPNGPPQ